MWGLPLSAGSLTICHFIGQLWTHCAPSVLPRPPASSGHHEQWSSAALWQVFVDVYTEPLPVDIDKFRHEETMIDAPSMYNCLLTFLTGPEDSTVALSLPPKSSRHQCLHNGLFGSDNAWGLSFARRFGRVYNELGGLGSPSPPSLSLSLSLFLSLSPTSLWSFSGGEEFPSPLPPQWALRKWQRLRFVPARGHRRVDHKLRRLLRLHRPAPSVAPISYQRFLRCILNFIHTVHFFHYPPKNPNIYNHYNKIINILMSSQILEEHYWYQGIFPWDFGHL